MNSVRTDAEARESLGATLADSLNGTIVTSSKDGIVESFEINGIKVQGGFANNNELRDPIQRYLNSVNYRPESDILVSEHGGGWYKNGDERILVTIVPSKDKLLGCVTTYNG